MSESRPAWQTVKRQLTQDDAFALRDSLRKQGKNARVIWTFREGLGMHAVQVNDDKKAL